MEREAELLMTFRGEYGRLCSLMARAIIQGHSEQHIVEAGRGKGAQAAPVYVQLRKQRVRMNRALEHCQDACVATGDMLQAARDAKHAIEREWSVRFPMVSEVS